jgi:hypothetical protein
MVSLAPASWKGKTSENVAVLTDLSVQDVRFRAPPIP